ncbi:MAG: methionine adenosyltransferase [Christensenellaceae bacterium]|jgi:S-adenosylmethionine synthetase|nr:methionine adenosyltransferase [Christensenellaceae bacterium]
MKNKRKIILTSESVNIGHPDKTCDYIADCFLDSALEQDANSQMAVECAIKDDLFMIYGEATTTAKIDYEKIARAALKQIGYNNEFRIVKQISEQSPDIWNAVHNDTPHDGDCINKVSAVDTGAEGGATNKNITGVNGAVQSLPLCANDQGIVYGYATNETPEYMPLPILLAHKLMRKYEEFRKERNDFFPDAKCQVSIEYENNLPKRVVTVLMSVSHSESCDNLTIKNMIENYVIIPVLAEYPKIDRKNMEMIINPSGKITIWGSFGDSGCVGRKIVVDTYGGIGRVGGGCFSSKNATKVDRSGAYYARYVAKNIVANKMADKCEIQVGYGIGLARPLAINIECFGTEKEDINKIYEYVDKNFDFSPANIIKELDLLKPIYKHTSCYGHFGRPEFPWEKIVGNIG